MWSVESASALLGLDATPLVLLDLHSHSWTDAPCDRVATFCSYDFVYWSCSFCL